MEVSRMIISEETRHKLNSPMPLSKKRKREIRVEGVKALIRSKHTGYKFSTAELIAAAGYRFESGINRSRNSGYVVGYNFILDLCRKGVIRKESFNGKMSAYSIPGDEVVVNKNIVQATTDELKTPTSNVNKVEHDNTESDVEYTIEFKITKRSGTDYGKTAVANLELHDTTLLKAEHMIIETINAVKVTK